MRVATDYNSTDSRFDAWDDADDTVVDDIGNDTADLDVVVHWSRSPGIWMVAAYIGLFIIRPWEVIAPWLGELRFEKCYAIAMILVVAVTGRRWRPTAQCFSIIAFATAVGLSAVFAWNSALSWEPLYRYATVVVTYFLIASVIRTSVDLYFLVMTYISVMWVYLAKSLWEYFVHGRHEFAQYVPRLLGIDLTYGEPNAVAMSTVVSLPLWVFLWRCRDRLTAGWTLYWKRRFQIAAVAYPLLAFVAVLLTNSRAGMLGFGAFVVLAHFRSQKVVSWPRSIALGIGMLCLLWVVSPQQQKDRLRTLWDPTSGPSNAHASADGRWQGFLASMQMFEREPLFGIGVGNFVDYRVSFLDGVPKVAHNLPGEILGETGLLGGIAFTAMIVVAWRNCSRTIRICKESAIPAADTFHELALSLSNSILLLLLFGLSLHNALRFNWLWIAAFALCLLMFTRQAEDLESCPREFTHG